MDAEDEEEPPPLIDIQREREPSVGGSSERNDTEYDIVTSLNAPIDDIPLDGGEFRLSSKDPPPVVLAEAIRQSQGSNYEPLSRDMIDRVWDNDNDPEPDPQENTDTDEQPTYEEISIPYGLDQAIMVESKENEEQEQTVMSTHPNESMNPPSEKQDVPMQELTSASNGPDDPNSGRSEEAETSKKENFVSQEETQKQCTPVTNNLNSCDRGVDCPPIKITIGQPEKDQLISAGLHILDIGQQLLTEMNFVETVINQFGPYARNGPDRESCNQSISMRMREQSLRTLMGTIPAQERRLSWQEQEKLMEESKNATRAARFGSGFESPHLSSTTAMQGPSTSRNVEPTVPDTSTGQNSQNNNSEFRKRLATLEMKIESMNSKLEACEKQVKDGYSTLCGALQKLSEEAAYLREKMEKGDEQGASLRSSVEDKISCFEQQISSLAKILWELKCEAKAQMHFGQFDC